MSQRTAKATKTVSEARKDALAGLMQLLRRCRQVGGQAEADLVKEFDALCNEAMTIGNRTREVTA